MRKSRDFNLLISTRRFREFDCRSEFKYILSEFGDEKAQVRAIGIPGLVTAKTSLNPFEVIDKLKELVKERPWEVRYTLKVIPIEIVVETDFNTIVEQAQRLALAKITEKETYRITVNKRFTAMSRRELIDAIAAGINRKVNLENPDKIVEIEILGSVTGISVLRQEDILSIVKLKRKLGVE